MLALHCLTCGAVSELDVSEVVATAQTITFVEAHYLHDEVNIRLRLTDFDATLADISYLVGRLMDGDAPRP